jgi:hypothetical protein
MATDPISARLRRAKLRRVNLQLAQEQEAADRYITDQAVRRRIATWLATLPPDDLRRLLDLVTGPAA